MHTKEKMQIEHRQMRIIIKCMPSKYSDAAASAIITFGAVVLMIWDVQNKLRRGIKHASGATQRYVILGNHWHMYINNFVHLESRKER